MPVAAKATDRTIRAYRAKRNFAATPEPAPKSARAPKSAAIFVVQKHDATRLHWDFRLEHAGVLLSWAVPKGPSLDPHDKRLAVHVEDHPIPYATFEGVIPEGNYGAGTVEIWDRGTWEPTGDVNAGLKKGELKFTLHGTRLNGGFVLVRLKPRPRERNDNWLLIKEHDDQEREGADAGALENIGMPAAAPGWQPPPDARRGALPAAPSPMLASTADALPEGDGWLAEIKFDGYRLLVAKTGETVRCLTRTGLDWTNRFPTIAAAVRALPAETLLLDGEVVALRENGLSSFADLQGALSAGRDRTLLYYVFDLLHRDGTDLRPATLEHRKAALAPLIPPQGPLRFSDHLQGNTAAVRQRACGMGLEGIIVKRAASPYRAGRGGDWLKVKCQGREEFLILGYTPPKGSRAGLGALLLGFRDPHGALHFAGGCGSGFADSVLKSLTTTLHALETDPPADLRLTDEPPPADAHWVRPELVAEVQYTAWSGAGRLRHAVFLGLREDKAAATVVRDIPDPETPRHTLARPGRAPAIVTARKPASRAIEAAGVRLTHADRELWPGITKQDLATYWQQVTAAAWPGIADRPLALVRCPDGIGGQHFFQKHLNRGMPPQILEGNEDGAPYLYLESGHGLIACAQMAAIELHGWGSTLPDAGHPERLIFDLDPADDVPWEAVIHAAQDLRDRFDRLDLATFPRTTGGKGLHLVVPIQPHADWPTARAWCRAFAEALEREHPTLYVASTPKAKRRGRILIDWLRNGQGSTAVCSFSPRAREGATVATPLAWRDVTPKLDPKAFTIRTVPARLAKQKRDPWHGFAAAARPLPET